MSCFVKRHTFTHVMPPAPALAIAIIRAVCSIKQRCSLRRIRGPHGPETAAKEHGNKDTEAQELIRVAMLSTEALQSPDRDRQSNTSSKRSRKLIIAS